MKRITKVLVELFICCGLLACKQDEVYFEYQNLNNSEWKRDSILVFKVDSSLIQKNKSYNILLELTNENKYHYKNIVIGYEIREKDSVRVIHQKNIDLADKYGQWLGSGIFSNFQVTDTLINNFSPIENGCLSIHLAQFIDEDLIGINKIGLRIIEKK